LKINICVEQKYCYQQHNGSNSTRLSQLWNTKFKKYLHYNITPLNCLLPNWLWCWTLRCQACAGCHRGLDGEQNMTPAYHNPTRSWPWHQQGARDSVDVRYRSLSAVSANTNQCRD